MVSKEVRSEQSKQWREKNHDKWTARIQCPCGSMYLYSNRSHHVKTQRHKYIMENLSMRKQLEEVAKSNDLDTSRTEYTNVSNDQTN